MNRGGDHFKKLVDIAVQTSRDRASIHYTELAYLLAVSPGYAFQIARAVAEVFAQEFEFKNGMLSHIRRQAEKE